LAIFNALSAFDVTHIPAWDPNQAESTTHTSTEWLQTQGAVQSQMKGTGFVYEEGDLASGVVTEWTVSSQGSAVFTVTGANYPVGNAPGAYAGDLWDNGYGVETGYPLYGARAQLAFALRGDDTVNGSSGNDHLAGFEGNDHLFGNAGNDTLRGWAGDDTIDGGAGVDTAAFLSFRGDTFVTREADHWTAWAIEGLDGTDTLSGIERLVFFNNEGLALDLDGRAGTVAKLIGAILGREFVDNETFVGIGLKLLDQGMSEQTLAQYALTALNKVDHGDIVDQLWHCVIGTPIAAADHAYFTGLLDSGMNPGALALMAANTSYNEANINLTGLAQQGLPYTLQGDGLDY
jgi:hypothetical protein